MKITLKYVGNYACYNNQNYTFYIKASSLDKELLEWTEVNPRLQKASKVKMIKESALENPKDFIKKNNGLFLSCEMIDKINEEDIEITFSNKNIHGIINGGHTCKALTSISKEDYEALEEDPIVIVNIVCGIKEKQVVVPIAIAKNDNDKVDKKSVMNLQEDFQPLREVLRLIDLEDKVAFKQNESRLKIDVLNFIKLLCVFDSSCKTPWQVMSSNIKLLNYYEDNIKDPSSNMSLLLAYSLQDLIEVYNFVEANLYRWYLEFCSDFRKDIKVSNALGLNFGIIDRSGNQALLRTKFPSVMHNKIPCYSRTFSIDDRIHSKVPTTFVLMVCHALSMFLVKKDGYLYFEKDIIEIINDDVNLRKMLVRCFLREIARLGWDKLSISTLLRVTGSDAWERYYNEIYRYVKESNII